jgi:3-oxoadipate enol-lactonase
LLVQVLCEVNLVDENIEESKYMKENFTKSGIYYEVKGEGEPIVLIRGLGRWTEHWCGWHELLTQKFKVLTLDNRGLGKSTRVVRGWHSMEDLAADVWEVLQTESIERAHIFGVSLGAMIALQFGHDFPQKALSVTAVNGSIGGSGHLRMTVPAAQALLMSPFNRMHYHQNIMKILLSPHCTKDVVDRYAAQWKMIDDAHPLPIRSVGAQLIIALKWNNPSLLSRIKVPVHIVVGTDDIFVPVGNSLFIHEKTPGSHLHKIQQGGHELHLDHPDELASWCFTNLLAKNNS